MSHSLIFLLVIAVTIAVFDVWIIYKKGKPSSLSATIIRISREMPLVTLLFGILLGHLFWSMRTDDIYENMECKEKVLEWPKEEK